MYIVNILLLICLFVLIRNYFYGTTENFEGRYDPTIYKDFEDGVKINTKNKVIPPFTYFLDDGMDKNMRLVFNECNKCCCVNQTKTNILNCKGYEKYAPSRYMCTSNKGNGCVCMTREQKRFYESRGANK